MPLETPQLSIERQLLLACFLIIGHALPGVLLAQQPESGGVTAAKPTVVTTESEIAALPENVVGVVCVEMSGQSLTGLQAHTSLQTLELIYCHDFDDFLAGLRTTLLTRLVVRGAPRDIFSWLKPPSSLSHVETLVLEGCTFASNAFSNIAQFPSLTTLVLQSMMDSGRRNLSELRHSPTLRSLTYSDSSSSSGVGFLQLRSLKQLKELRLRVPDGQHLPAMIAELPELQAFHVTIDASHENLDATFLPKQIASLSISCERGGPWCVTGLEALEHLSVLELDGWRVNDDLIADIAKLTRLRTLKLAGTGACNLNPLASLASLEDIDLRLPTAGRQSMQFLHGLPSLVSISLMWIHFDKLESWQSLAAKDSLRSLSLYCCRGLPYGWTSGIAKLPHLSTLCAWRAPCSPQDIEEVSGCSSLESLQLRQCFSSGHWDCKLLCRLERLRHLDLSGSEGVGNDVACCLALPALVQLNLSDCRRVNDQWLDGFNGLSGVRILLLSRTELTAEGLQHLIQLENLEELHLCGMLCIASGGLELLQRLPTVKSLNLFGCGFDPSAINAYRKMRPACHVRCS